MKLDDNPPKAPCMDIPSTDGEESRIYGEGDTYLVQDVLPEELAATAFDNLKKEVKWRQMFHRGGEVPRLVAVEGIISQDGSYPIYRHPSDTLLPLDEFSPTVQRIHHAIQPLLPHPLNHVLIQYYRHGGDYISEHSDKTIDVAMGSNIVNVSLGAERTMTLRTKKDYDTRHPHDGEGEKVVESNSSQHPGARITQRIPLPNNSMLVMGLETNRKWLHSIRTDKRPTQTKSPAETAFDGERISLTFRHIGTYLVKDPQDGTTKIYGQGAIAKRRQDAQPVVCETVCGGNVEMEKLIIAFGEENHDKNFDWARVYGEGSNAVMMQMEDNNP